MSNTPSKQALRDEAREWRAELARANPDHRVLLAAQAGALAIPPGSIIGAYIAKGDEADPRLLLERLSAASVTIAFPRVAAADAPLDFHHRKRGRAFVKGAFGIQEPRADWPLAVPNFLLVPLLAFDSEGYRLGYGGGFYDRTLAAIGSRATAIGVAYAGQEVAQVPREAHDRPLDLLVSELGVRRFG